MKGKNYKSFTSSQPLLPEKKLDLPGERKLVTVIFADLVGFTRLAENMDPEYVRDLMNSCFDQLVPVINKFGGTVDKFIGDEIMALFGAPLAHENDAERALRAALQMQEELKSFNKTHQISLNIHFGINSGLVIAGYIGSANRQEFSVLGDAVNLAAHLGHLAQGGEILVGPDTFRQTRHIFTFQELGPLRLKGKLEPVLAYKLLGLRPKPIASWRGKEAREISSPLVGREKEINILSDCLQNLLAGKGGLVAILGEAGLGKSRLVAEVRRKFSTYNFCFLEGRALSFSQGISYYPFLEIIQGDAGIGCNDLEDERWPKLENRLQELFPEDSAEILPYLATLLNLKIPEPYSERIKYLDAETMGHQLFRAVKLYFAQLARQRPLVLIFEDLHWADQSSALLLEHLFPLTKEVPLLLWSVGRPDPGTPALSLREIGANNYAEYYREIVLNPFTPLESFLLVSNLLPIDKFPPSWSKEILDKAEGNPFFLEEIVRALIDLGAFARDKMTGKWRTIAKATATVIPDTLQGVIMARVDTLGEDLKELLRLASVIGRIFFYRVLHALTKNGHDLDQQLQELQNLEIVRERKRIPEWEFAFKHVLVQETIYQSILLQKRKELHYQVGKCMEELFADRLAEFYGLLAFHFTQAQKWEIARDYLLKAGDQAGKMAADTEALEHYRRALEAHAQAFGNRWEPEQKALLERKMGEALFRRGQNQLGREYMLRALNYLGRPYPQTKRGIYLAIGKNLLFQVAFRIFPKLWRLKEKEKLSLAQELCQIYATMAWMDYFMAPPCLLLDSLLILNIAEQHGLAVEEVLASMGVGLALNNLPSPWLAHYYHKRAVELAEKIKKPHALGQAYFGLALHEHHALGEAAAALKHYRRSAKGYWEAGNLRSWASVKMAQSLLWIPENISERLRLCEEVIQVSQDAGDRQAWGWGLFMLAATLDQAGEVEAAIAKMVQALDLVRSVPDYQVITYASAILARCYLRQGDIPKAFTALHEGASLIYQHHLRGFSCVPNFIYQAQAYLMLAERTRTAEDLQKAYKTIISAAKQSKFSRAAEIITCRLRGSWEWLRGHPNRACQWWGRSLRLANILGSRYEGALTKLEMGRLLRNKTYLIQAKETFCELQAKHDMQQAQKLMDESAHGKD